MGSRLLHQCLQAAKNIGFVTCYLETLYHMHQARKLYEKHGFRLLDGPMGCTGHFSCEAWYARDI